MLTFPCLMGTSAALVFVRYKLQSCTVALAATTTVAAPLQEVHHVNDSSCTRSLHTHPERVDRGSVWEVLKPARLAETATVVFKKRENGARTQIVGHVVIIWFLLFDSGVFQFEFLYTRKKFGWDYFTYTLFSITKSLMRAMGSFVIMPTMSYRFRVEDSLLGFTGAASYMFQYIITATAPVGWVLFVAGVASCCCDMSFGSSRGALSKLVTEEELGAIFSIVAVGEAVLPLASGPLFTAVYNATLDVFPGAIFALTSCFFAIICCLYTWLMTRPERPLPNNVKFFVR
ncbi:probable peptidoglycan muropeptide transporter SLC46 [Procambarus clarkii]|uniref:probable peptidoglycan muropeptide transporter SLC46 n=1 Tax=Procambarus clarkii TaxID=6728 RepID=UPI0037441F84